ncbi:MULTISPECIES: hypothetical protein [unclassified Fibrobacter]|uniref:hypothetical protein n=1 Tax=unclassified Fibrobacter TaxID=2634177 RepID=UPI000D6A9934|nr:MULTISPECIES: hypothetical protein [unclassified Fibrobacter]PWJ68141.1 hypothetical protein BGX12_11067 [Fibrobacter sp. UWR4]PZW71876.1 hypothetical protein C8E88_100968 [Fibrobacter sp. UWR1]
MAISTAIQKGNYVYVYDEKNSHKFSMPGELMGFTSSTVTIKRGNYANVYDEKGSHKFSKPI